MRNSNKKLALAAAAVLGLSAATARSALAGYTLTTLASLNGTNGSSPYGGVILSGGTLYGTAYVGGVNEGTVFSVPVGGGNVTTLVTFNSANGGRPYAGVVLSGSTLYGTTNQGGGNTKGTVFSAPVGGGNVSTLATFNGTNGSYPYAGLTVSGSTLYGTTSAGGSKGGGTVFSVPVAGGIPTTLAAFNGPNGSSPWAGVILSGSTLYGTTEIGGANGDGTVFSVPVGGGNVTTLATFNSTNGSQPYGGLILSGSTLYGTTSAGGNLSLNGGSGDGTVFSIPVGGGNVTTLATFNGSNGRVPESTLVLSGSTLYGTTYAGGANSEGTVFSVPVGGGNITTLVSFDDLNGCYPIAGLTVSGSTLYGAASDGGADIDGTVFALSPVTATTYTLAATITGNRVVNGRITQGQSANLGATINNTGGNGTDNLQYDTLSIGNCSGVSMTCGSGNIAPSGNGTATGTFTAHTLGWNTLTATVGNATNATVGNAATCQGSTNASVYVDALVEHVNGASITDNGNASTTPTAFYRGGNLTASDYAGGENLGNVTVTKQAPGSYIPAFANHINGGNGTSVGTLKINVSGNDNQFGSDTSIIMLGFTNVNHLGDPATEKSNLSTIEAALNTAGVEWRDAFGDNSSNWPGLTGGLDPLTGTTFFQNVADYDIELAFAPNTLTSSTSYFDFNFTDQLGTAGDVVNIAVVPEPASMSLLVAGSVGLLARRRRRNAA